MIGTGCRVRVKGLAAAAQHNGKEGRYIGTNAESGRLTVELDGGEVVSVKQQNVDVILGRVCICIEEVEV